ncbi:unnamed protein product [Malus baccata var. baccata]
MALYNNNDAWMYKMFPFTLKGLEIRCLANIFTNTYSVYYDVHKCHETILKIYLKHFCTELVEIEKPDDRLAIMAFKKYDYATLVECLNDLTDWDDKTRRRIVEPNYFKSADRRISDKDIPPLYPRQTVEEEIEINKPRTKLKDKVRKQGSAEPKDRDWSDTHTDDKDQCPAKKPTININCIHRGCETLKDKWTIEQITRNPIPITLRWIP